MGDAVLRYDGTTGAPKGYFISPGAGGLAGPAALTFGPDGNVYVASSENVSVLRYDKDGNFIDVFASAYTATAFVDISFGPDGDLYVTHIEPGGMSNPGTGVIRFDGQTGAYKGRFASVHPPQVGAYTTHTYSLLFHSSADLLIGVGWDEHRVSRYAAPNTPQEGSFVTNFVPYKYGGLGSPYDMEYGPDGDVYVLSINLGEGPSEYGKILRYDDNGNFKGEFISYVGDARAITFGPDTNLYVFVMGKVKSYIGPNKPGAGTFITNFTPTVGLSINSTWPHRIVFYDHCSPIVISPTTLPNGLLGKAYSQALQASGGQAPYTFALTGGSLPPGLMPSANGVISGTPTATGNYTFTITVTDKDGCTASQTYTISIQQLKRFNYTLIPWPYFYIYKGDPPPPGPWEIVPNSIAQVIFESDVEQLRYTVTELPRNGTIQWASHEVLNYMPNKGFVGTDGFTVKVMDQKGITRNLAISITVISR